MTKRSLICASLLLGTSMPVYAQTGSDPAADTRAPEPSPAPDTSPTQDRAAAQPPPEATRAPGGIEDIVVTATRREERLQDVPVTVSAVTSAALDAADVSTVRELTQVIPGFTGGRLMGVFQPVIRGVGSTGISIGDEPNIATYIDGVYYPETAANWIDLVEVERVEVLRGPQGTTFGRNATGGLINVITPEPSFTPRGRVALRYGRMRNDANEYDARIYMTGPVGEKLAVDFAGLFRKNDGYIEDLVRGGVLGDAEIINVRSKLLFRPNDRMRMILTGEYFYQDSSSNAVQPVDGNTLGRNCTLLPSVCAQAIVPDGPWQTATDVAPFIGLSRYNLALRTQFEFGAFNLETTSGYMAFDWKQLTDSDASNIPLAIFPATFDAENFSQEIKLLSTGSGPLQWLVGAYYYWFDGTSDIDIFQAVALFPPLGLPRVSLDPELSGESLAGFAEATYAITPEFFVTVGGRYTTEKRDFIQAFLGRQLFDVDKSFNKWTYRGALRYNFAEDANVYVSYGTGFKSGVFNMAGTSPNPVDPETIKAWEGGIKADPLHWLRTNLSIFHYTYDDMQVNAKAPNSPSFILQNAASAKIYGGELEAQIAPTRDLNLRAAVAYLHARYEDFPDAQSFIPLPGGGNLAAAADASGNVVTRAPEWTFNLGGEWGRDLGAGRLGIAGNIFHSSKLYYDFQNIFFQKAYTLANASISWTTLDGAWRFTLWGTNLTNAKVYQQMRPSIFGTDTLHEQPRKIGIGVENRF